MNSTLQTEPRSLSLAEVRGMLKDSCREINTQALLDSAFSKLTKEEVNALGMAINETSERLARKAIGPGYPPMPESGPRFLSATELEAWLKNPDRGGNRQAFIDSAFGKMSGEEGEEFERHLREADEWLYGKDGESA